jgi:DNA-binding response OmpR family regulator
MTHQLDMAIVDSLSPSGAGYDFVSWLRQTPKEPNCYIPVLVTTGHTPARDVTRARDCGGHILVKKPIAPVVMLERIIWVSKEGRTFLYSDGYVGPDRRFRDEPPADGIGRRRGDALAPASADTADTADTADAADVAETVVQEREAS